MALIKKLVIFSKRRRLTPESISIPVLLILIISLDYFVSFNNVGALAEASQQQQNQNSFGIGSNPYEHRIFLDKKEKYLLEWEVDWLQNRIIFSATVETLGYVGFGLSKNGKMLGADIVIGGISPSGVPYFKDYHAIGNQLPVEDPSQDWTLLDARENSSHSFLRFSRPLVTCDEEHDLIINNDVITIIWAYGERDDELMYHFQNRGSQPAYLLDPDLAPKGFISLNWTSPEKFLQNGIQIWAIRETQLIPAKKTTYLCSIYRFPSPNKKHIIGFNPILPPEVLERNDIHHFILFRCTLPPNLNPEEIFQPLLGLKEECYILQQPIGRIPTNYCQDLYYADGTGDISYFLPDHVGLPIGDFGRGENEYFMLQAHFDNPNKIPGRRIDYGLEIFTTDKLRENDAGAMLVGRTFPASPGIMIPPGSLGHSIYGHCGTECTKLILPPEGIRAFAMHLHTHGTGRRVRLSQIRAGRELPYIANDDKYFPLFQRTRVFRSERTILPGDQLIYRCVHETTDRKDVTIGGFHTANEMCVGTLYYYNKIPNRGICASEMRSQTYRDFLQIYNTSWSNEDLEMIVTSPLENFGLPVSAMGNMKINWTIEKRRRLQELQRYLPQITMCPPLLPEPEVQKSFILPQINKNGNNYGFTKVQNEILYPQTEFVSVYENNVISYKKHEDFRCL